MARVHELGRCRRWAVASIVTLAGAAGAWAQAPWTVTNLHPAIGLRSTASAVEEWEQVGSVRLVPGQPLPGEWTHAALWRGSAGTWVDLDPGGGMDSYAVSTSRGKQMGWAVFGGPRAVMWSGTADSCVNLHPAGSDKRESFGTGIWGDHQVGYVNIQPPGQSYFSHASLWSGTAASWVDLHPAGATESVANAVFEDRQVGRTIMNGIGRASLWNGTAQSWVDLTPLGITDCTSTSIYRDRQGGAVTLNGKNHASLWSGTAASWIDLNPAGATESVVSGIDRGGQSGWAMVNGVQHACVWNGSAASWIDLHLLLPAGFTSSYASGIGSDLDNSYVVGAGFNSITGHFEALMWSVPSPSGAVVLVLGGLLSARRRR